MISSLSEKVGFRNLRKALRREAKIKSRRIKGYTSYLWYIGVHPSMQGQGLGTRVLSYVLNEAEKEGRTLCLETSVLSNIKWYQDAGLRVYELINLGYKLYFLKAEQRQEN